MGKKNNVNPDHYKEEGRERPGQDINQEINKQKYTQSQTRQRIQNNNGGSNLIPGTAPVGESRSNEGNKGETGQVSESANASSNT